MNDTGAWQDSNRQLCPGRKGQAAWRARGAETYRGFLQQTPRTTARYARVQTVPRSQLVGSVPTRSPVSTGSEHSLGLPVLTGPGHWVSQNPSPPPATEDQLELGALESALERLCCLL